MIFVGFQDFRMLIGPIYIYIVATGYNKQTCSKKLILCNIELADSIKNKVTEICQITEYALI